MAGLGKWIGGGLGWALGGPIGGILGFIFGSLADGMHAGTYEIKNQQTTSGDFTISLLILTASMMRADGKVKRAELDLVKQFLISQFGPVKASELSLVLREILKQDYDLHAVCLQINRQMEYPSRLQLIHFLFHLSRVDGDVHPNEWQLIKQVGSWMGIAPAELTSLQAMFMEDQDAPYRILEIGREASEEEIKKAYRRLAMRHHPDKVSHLGPDVQKAAEEKFRALNDAYEKIRKARNMN